MPPSGQFDRGGWSVFAHPSDGCADRVISADVGIERGQATLCEDVVQSHGSIYVHRTDESAVAYL